MVPVHVCPSCRRYLSSSRIFLRDRAPCRSFAYHPAPLRIRSFTPLMLAYYYWIWLLRRCIAVLRRVILAAHQKHHAADHFPLATTQRGHGRPRHMGDKQDTAPLFWPLNLRSIHASLCPGHDIFLPQKSGTTYWALSFPSVLLVTFGLDCIRGCVDLHH